MVDKLWGDASRIRYGVPERARAYQSEPEDIRTDIAPQLSAISLWEQRGKGRRKGLQVRSLIYSLTDVKLMLNFVFSFAVSKNFRTFASSIRQKGVTTDCDKGTRPNLAVASKQ